MIYNILIKIPLIGPLIAGGAKTMGDIASGLSNGLKGIGDWVGGAFENAGNTLFGKKVQKFHSGGIVTSPTFGLIGEAGPEAIMPLGYLGSMIEPSAGNSSIEENNFNFNTSINVTNSGGSNGVDVSRLADKVDAVLYDRFKRRFNI
jgi:phage-related minor tail protein